MSIPGLLSERVIILAPLHNENQAVLGLLQEAGIPALIAHDLNHLVEELKSGAGLALLADTVLEDGDRLPLTLFLDTQPAWSDLPVILLTSQDSPGQTARLAASLGNVTLLPRPLDPLMLGCVVNTAIRGRRRQYEARARMEHAQESERRLQHALRAGRLGPWQLEAEYLTLDCSPASKAHFGRQECQAFSYDDWLNAFYPDDQPRMQSALQRSLDSGEDFNLECRNLWPDGSMHWVELRARAIRARNGRVALLAGVSSDITERKVAETQLHRLNESLEQQVEERTSQLRQNEEVLRQSQKMEAVGQLTGGIAHDFNNMLTGIIGSLELMRRRIARGRTEDLDGLIDLGVTSATRAAALTHRLLAFSRRQSLDAKPVEMNQLVASMSELLERSLNESIRLETWLADDLWTAEVDPNQLESALLNLVLNARDAIPSGGLIVIETTNQRLDQDFTEHHDHLRPGDYVVLSVSDTGCGMPQEVINRAFDPFFTTKPIGQGTGLGLSMIYGFARQSHGHVTIESRVGHGTTVCLYLPRFQGNRETLRLDGEVPRPEARAGESILLVEDDPSVQALVSQVLGEHGYHLLAASSADSALPMIRSQQRIDLMISDVGLPGMNGRELAQLSRETRPELKVLFITGYAEDATVRAGFLDRDMQLMTKPFALEQLVVKVREMIEA